MSWDILPKANLQYFLQKLKGKLDAIRQGHGIIADGGTSLPQEDNLQFGGVYVHDDSTNGKTKVNIVREFQSVAEIEALTGEAKKGFEVIEDNEEYIPYTGSDILFDNTDTSFEGENVQEVLEEVDSKIDNLNADDIEYSSGVSVKDKIDDVESSTTWKWVGSASGTSEINLPQTWKELVAQVRTNNANLNTFHLYNIQRDSMDATSFGNYGTSYAIGYISKTKIRISSVNWAGQDSTANSILYVYYR